MIGYLKEIADKLWSIGKFLIPVYGMFELLRVLFSRLLGLLKDWVSEWIARIWGLVKEQMAALEVDLTPGPAFQSMIAKLNVVVPLEEMWFYLLAYLGVASVVLGVKWMRNLVPGLK